jgi:hypothetical protein
VSDEPYPWVRRETERGAAYAAFREYLNLGHRRTIREAAELAGITPDTAGKLSQKHDWVVRATAHDQFVASRETDGLASQIASARDEDIDFANQMRDHAVGLLQDFVRDRAVPPAAYSQFVLAFVRLEEHAFRFKDDPKTSAAKERAQELLARAERAMRA